VRGAAQGAGHAQGAAQQLLNVPQPRQPVSLQMPVAPGPTQQSRWATWLWAMQLRPPVHCIATFARGTCRLCHMTVVLAEHRLNHRAQ